MAANSDETLRSVERRVVLLYNIMVWGKGPHGQKDNNK